MEFAIIELVVSVAVLATLIIVPLAFFKTHKKKARAFAQEHCSMNDSARNFLEASSFNISNSIVLNDYYSVKLSTAEKQFIYIDQNAKKICFIDYLKKKPVLIDFSELLNYEIYENGSTITDGSAVSGVFAGVFTAETTGQCRDLKLIIRLKKYDCPQVVYEIIGNTVFNFGVNKNSDIYHDCISTLQEAVSFLEVVKHENEASKN